MRTLPDANISASVSRVPGISLKTDTGEKCCINIRGIDTDLACSLFGALRVLASNNASPFGGGRAVALDAIPTGLVGATTVNTSHLPEQGVLTLGDRIEITSKRTSRIGKFFMDAYVGTGREQLRGADISDFSISTVTRFGGITTDRGAIEGVSDALFSSVFTASFYADKRAIDHVESEFIDDDVNLPLACAGWERRYHQYNCNRLGVGLDVGYEPGHDNNYYFRALDAGYTETVQRNRLAVTPDGAGTLANGQFTDRLTGSGFDKTLRDEQEPINNKLFGRGGKNRIGKNVFEYCLGSIRGAFTELYDYNFDVNFAASAGTVAYDNRGKASTRRFRVDGPDHLDPATKVRIRFQNSTQDIHVHQSSVSTNLKIPVNLLGHEDASLKVRLSGRWRTRSATGQSYSCLAIPAASLVSAVTGGNLNFYEGACNNGPKIIAGKLQNALTARAAINRALRTQAEKGNLFVAYVSKKLCRLRRQCQGNRHYQKCIDGADRRHQELFHRPSKRAGQA